jgi:hypothetical protein
MAGRASFLESKTVSEKRFSQLSKPGQVLIRLCQYVNFGSILNLKVADGDIVFEHPPEIIVDVRLDGDVPQRPEFALPDFVLASEACRLLAQIESLKTGLVEKITVHAGIPRRMFVRRVPPREVTL